MLEQTQIKQFVGLRRQVIAREYSHLNAEQRKGVLATEGPLLLLAGAGSGKTTVLIHRIANLIKYGCGSDSNEVPDWVTPEDVRCLEAVLKNRRRAGGSGRRCCASCIPQRPGPFWLSHLPIKRRGS